MTPHSQRCETCKNGFCSLKGSRSVQNVPCVPEKDCASHSDFQSEREKILDEKACSYLVYQIRVKTGKEGYSCTSEEDTAGSCCRNGICVFEDGKLCK